MHGRPLAVTVAKTPFCEMTAFMLTGELPGMSSLLCRALHLRCQKSQKVDRQPLVAN